jgi:uncharacterized RDD family membrane protein YckC
VKCPKCGYINFPGLEQCKKCGHPFVRVNGHSNGASADFNSSLSGFQENVLSSSESVLDETELDAKDAGELDVALDPRDKSTAPAGPEEQSPESKPPQTPGLSPWQAELAERVQEYRQRRARLNKDEKAGPGTLGLDFGPASLQPEEPQPNVIEFPSAEGEPNRPTPKRIFKPAPPSYGMRSFELAFQEENNEGASQPPHISKKEEPRAETGPLEIELGPSEGATSAIADASAVHVAPMSARFYAALIDAAVLAVAAAIYALIFWEVGGSFSLNPLALGIALVIGAFFILLYFAGCTALASATPGLIWMGLEVVTFEGNHPRLSECLWRGFGYLVSMSALMLGFIWAAVDAEGLTWHDRMSRTFIVPASRP